MNSQVGDSLKGFQLLEAGVEERTVTARTYANKGVLIHFMQTTCKPCLDDLALLRSLHERYGGEHFDVLSVSSEKLKLLKSFSDYHKLPWVLGYDKRNLLRARLGAEHLPTTVYMGPDARIAGRVQGSLDARDAQDAVERLIILAREAQRR